MEALGGFIIGGPWRPYNCCLLKLVLRSQADRGGARGSVRGSVPWVGSAVSRGSVPVFFGSAPSVIPPLSDFLGPSRLV